MCYAGTKCLLLYSVRNNLMPKVTSAESWDLHLESFPVGSHETLGLALLEVVYEIIEALCLT